MTGFANHRSPGDADAAVAEDIRQTMVRPLFERPLSLVIGHGASLMLPSLGVFVVPGGHSAYFVVVELLMCAWRIAILARAQRLRRQGGVPAMITMVPAYFAMGLGWSAVGGLFLAWTSLTPLENPLRMITIIVCCGTCSGVVGRNSGTPVFARSSVMLWLTPAASVALFLGPWNQLFALLVAIYGLVMCNMINQLHSDLLNTVTVQRTNAALVAHFDAALSNMSQGLLLYDPTGAVRVINRRFFSLFGLAEGTVTTGQYASDVLNACRPNLQQLDRRDGDFCSLESWAAGGHPQDHIELADGRIIAVLPWLLADGGQIVTYEDVSERVRSQARIAHMARHDALTDLPNRVLFHERAEEAIAWLGRGEPFAVAYFDLNKFKSVNDALGHGVGDELLQQVAQRLRACVREVDLAARLGGDEFAIVLPGLRDECEAELLTKRLINTLSAPYLIDDHEVCIGVSIGWALAPRDGATVDALMTQADQGMYAAKAASRSAARDKF